MKQFKLFGYKVNPDHIHLLIQPGNKNNYSEIMRSIKTNFSRNINFVMGFNELINVMKVGLRNPAFFIPFFKKHMESLNQFKKNFIKKYSLDHDFPKFQWQTSFHDHIIRDKSDLVIHTNYIKLQWKKHKLEENKYCFTRR